MQLPARTLFSYVQLCATSSACCSQASSTAQDPGINEDWVPGDGWFAWATKAPLAANASQIDKLRAELRTEFNAAVQHAYLGPR